MTLSSNLNKIKKSNVDKYWELGKKGKGITIAVMDERPCILDSMNKDLCIVPSEFQSYISKSRTHATQCAEVIHEVAPEARIVFLPYMCTKQGCVDWLRQHQKEIDMISMSLAVGSEVEALTEFDIPVIAAAGNKGAGTAEISKPARYDWAIGVGGWIEDLDSIYIDSSYGDGLDCVTYTAIDILNSKGKVVPMTGTSAACPWCAAMLACYYTGSQVPNVTEIRKLIKANCVDVLETGKDRGSGYGRFVLPDPASAISLSIVLTLNETIAKVNDTKVELDTAPFAVNGMTYVPVRFVAENLGCQVSYANGVVTITQENRTITFTMNSSIVAIDGVPKDIGVEPLVKNNRILLPLRVVAESLGCMVNYKSGVITITK